MKNYIYVLGRKHMTEIQNEYAILPDMMAYKDLHSDGKAVNLDICYNIHMYIPLLWEKYTRMFVPRFPGIH